MNLAVGSQSREETICRKFKDMQDLAMLKQLSHSNLGPNVVFQETVAFRLTMDLEMAGAEFRDCPAFGT